MPAILSARPTRPWKSPRAVTPRTAADSRRNRSAAFSWEWINCRRCSGRSGAGPSPQSADVSRPYELALALGSAAIATWLWAGWRRAEQEGARLRRSLQERQAERDRWRASAEQALTGLASAIQRQFEEWGFTEAERDVAMQLLRGLSHTEIAAATGRSDRTVRQHAAAAYQKAGLEGRASLAAFFLEGLIPPAQAKASLPAEALSPGGHSTDT